MPTAIVRKVEGGLHVSVETPQGCMYVYTAGELSAAYVVAKFFDAVDVQVTEADEDVVHSSL